MCVSETVWKGRLIRRCERLEIPSFVFNTLVRQVPALSTPPLSLLFFFSPRSSLPDTFFALTLERYSFIPTIACLLCFISLRNSWESEIDVIEHLGNRPRFFRSTVEIAPFVPNLELRFSEHTGRQVSGHEQGDTLTIRETCLQGVNLCGINGTDGIRNRSRGKSIDRSCYLHLV